MKTKDYIKITDEIEKKLDDLVSGKRRAHIDRVRKYAEQLAAIHGKNRRKAVLAALFHDYCKGNEEEFAARYGQSYLSFVRENGAGEIDENPSIRHGVLGAFVAREEYGIEDDEILQAVIFHSTGTRDFGDTGKILYLADKLEPGREYDGVDDLRKAAGEDLDRGFYETLNHSLLFLANTDQVIAIHTLLCRNQMIKEDNFGR